MAWNQISLYAPKALAEKISDYLSELGAVAVTLQEGGEDRVFEPLPGETRLWEKTQVVGLFEEDLDLELVLSLLRQKFTDQLPQVYTERIEDQDWERAWLKDFKPMQFGRRLWIIPSTFTPVDEGAINIFLDPGLAFGTGTHATTAMCLQWLDSHDIAGKTCLDFGCGSGILAIAAAKLGASEVDGVDIDPQAIDATRMNAANNGVAEAIKTYLPEQFSWKTVDILLANILAKPLISLADQFAKNVVPGGSIVLSGILEEQADEVLAAYGPEFNMQKECTQDGWVLLVGTKK
ncbi:MAG: 50S ribosomal protein L11 methyltransferase [Gammaproteobacteria bacterium]|nr:50S ribosomal protein L11 methyltransferase [Gammaproteobacteria bacterium]